MDELYPKSCRKSIRILSDRLCSDAETVYQMMLMTAALMDLHPDDDQVVEMILIDCNVEVET